MLLKLVFWMEGEDRLPLCSMEGGGQITNAVKGGEDRINVLFEGGGNLSGLAPRYCVVTGGNTLLPLPFGAV